MSKLLSRIFWQSHRFSNFQAPQLYQVLQARAQVFGIEQQSLYQDCDDLDQVSWHLIAWSGEELAAYARVIDPACKYPEPALGRLLVVPNFRRQGLAQELVRRALLYGNHTFAGLGMRMTAQTYLIQFYQGFGFQVVSEEFLINEIPHVEMYRSAGEL